jgi:hypothetical protein
VLVQRRELRRDAVVGEEALRVARVLREHGVHGTERVERPQSDVAQIPDRRGHHI